MSEKTYNNILQTSYELFAHKGYDATSMNEIVAKTGISKGNLYHHFTSKEELLLKIVEKYMTEEFFKGFIDIKTLTKNNFQDRLITAGYKHIQNIQQDPLRKKFDLQLITLMTRFENIHQKLQPTIMFFREMIFKLIETGINLNAIPHHINRELTCQKIFIHLDMLEFYAAFNIELDLKGIWRDLIKSICNS